MWVFCVNCNFIYLKLVDFYKLWIKGELCSFGERIQTNHFNIDIIIEAILQTLFYK